MKKHIALFICPLLSLASVAWAEPDKPTLKSDGVTLEISVPSKVAKPDGTVPAFLILKNGGSQPIRYSTECQLGRSVMGEGGNKFDVSWGPGMFTMDAPSDEEALQEVAKHVQILQPGESAKFPFFIFAGKNKTMYVTARYSAESPDLKKIGLWYGHADAEPLTLQLDK